MLKKIWKDPVWSTCISGLIAVAAGYFGLNVLKQVWKTTWRFLIASSLIPHGLLLVLIGLLVALVVYLGLTARSASREAGPAWKSYNQDVFAGVLWHWEYYGGTIENLAAFCPGCDYRMRFFNPSGYNAISYLTFVCDICGSEYPFSESLESVQSKVERLIDPKVRTGTWVTRKTSTAPFIDDAGRR